MFFTELRDRNEVMLKLLVVGEEVIDEEGRDIQLQWDVDSRGGEYARVWINLKEMREDKSTVTG